MDASPLPLFGPAAPRPARRAIPGFYWNDRVEWLEGGTIFRGRVIVTFPHSHQVAVRSDNLLLYTIAPERLRVIR